MELGTTYGRVSIDDIKDWDTLSRFIYANINCIGKYKNAIIRKMREIPVILDHSLTKLLVKTVIYSGVNARDTAEILMEFAANAELPDIYPSMNEFDVAVIMCSSFHKLDKWIERDPEKAFSMIIDILAEGCPSGVENLNLIKDFISMNYTNLASLKSDANGSLAEVEAKFNSFNLASGENGNVPCNVGEFLWIFKELSDLPFNDINLESDVFHPKHLKAAFSLYYKNEDMSRYKMLFGNIFKDDLELVIAEIIRCWDYPVDDTKNLVGQMIERMTTLILVLSRTYNIDKDKARAIVFDVRNNTFGIMISPIEKEIVQGIIESVKKESINDDILDEEFFMFLNPEEQVESINRMKKSFESIEDTEDIATEGRSRRRTSLVNKASNKIYNGYKAYKNEEQKIDSQLTKTVKAMGKLAVGDTRTEIIEGKSYTVIGLLKKFLGTAALFAFGPIKGLCALLIRYAYKKNTSASERRKIVNELDTEIEIIDEKIEDAKRDENTKAKYAMMRTRAELIRARNRIRAGLPTTDKLAATVKETFDK